MADTSDKILRTYIDTLLRLQQKRDETIWSDAELRQTAIEAGMTEADLAYVRQHLDDCMNRGKGFLRYRNWTTRSRSFNWRRALAPNDVEALGALATAYAGRWSRDGDAADREMALQRAERVLQLDSRNDAALRIISALRTNRAHLLGDARDPASSGRRLRLAIAGILLMVVIAAVAFLSRPSRPDPVEASDPIPSPERPEPAPAPEPSAPSTPADGPMLTFGREGTGPGLLTDARTIAVDEKGQVYVAGYSDGRIQVFDSAGNYLRQWNIGSDNYIRDLDVDRKGIVYVVYGGRIHRYDRETGESLGEVRYAGGPGFVSVAVMADGGLAAAWDGLWRGGLLINPKSQDNLVVFGANMKVAKTLRNLVSGASGSVVFSPQVAVDGLGNFYMIGESNESVYRFTPQGTFVDKFGGGKGPGQMRWIQGIAVNGRGHVFVSDHGGVHEFDGDGGYIGSIEVHGPADAIAFNSRDEIYVVSRTKVMKFAAR